MNNINLKKTLTEVTNIIQELKGKVDNHIAWTGTEQADLEKRLTHLLDKNQPEGSTKLDTDLKDLESLDNVFNIGLLNANNENRKLEAEKEVLIAEKEAKEAEVRAEKAKLSAKEAELQKKITEIAGLTEAKITKELIDKINALDSNPTKLAELKTLLEEVKAKKGAEVNQIVEEVKKNQPNSLSIYGILACSILGLVGVAYNILKNSSETKGIYGKDDE